MEKGTNHDQCQLMQKLGIKIGIKFLKTKRRKMAILNGFPPSNTISCGISIVNSIANPAPIIVEKVVKLSQLRVEDRFRYDKTGVNHDAPQEFMYISKDYKPESGIPVKVRAICYKSPLDPEKWNIEVGEVFDFDASESVIWLQITYDGKGLEPDCCRGCGEKLVKDNFSNEYGDYCPNNWCETYS